MQSEKLIELNLALAWIWMVLGFAAGFVLGTHFHREDWLGGYTSLPRRMCRLGHISFFGLGVVNFMFYCTAQILRFPVGATVLASWAFAIGTVAMPACCFTMAFYPRLRPLFLVPVLSLLIGGLTIVWEIITS